MARDPGKPGWVTFRPLRAGAATRSRIPRRLCLSAEQAGAVCLINPFSFLLATRLCLLRGSQPAPRVLNQLYCFAGALSKANYGRQPL
ncbi:hypothetical protein GQ53DRAFT_163525 [Thozetella sp. PMI_491]|nr:hypothetical protein GQ53DRAFT_163525 [Thozetella sp. PMI_491]